MVFSNMEPNQLLPECEIAKGVLTGIVRSSERHRFVKHDSHVINGAKKVVEVVRNSGKLVVCVDNQFPQAKNSCINLIKPELAKFNYMLRVIVHSQNNLK